MSKNNNNQLVHLKRKHGQIFLFDVDINKINTINIISKNGKSTLIIEEHNTILYIFPSYMRIRRNINLYNSLNIDKNKIQICYIPKKKKKTNRINKEKNEQQIENEKNFYSKDKNNTNYKNKDNENKIFNNNYFSNKININFKDKVKNLTPINKDDIQLIKITGDGNCFYRCISFFLLGSEDFYEDIKNYIINWIDNNRSIFEDFFGDNLFKSKLELAEEEYQYIKQKNSWGGFHTIEIACLIFNISIGVYIDNGDNRYIRYSFSENLNKNSDLMLLSYYNDSHFDLLYDINAKLDNLVKNLTILNIKKPINNNKDSIIYQGNKFNNNYVLTNFKGKEYLYDEISDYLKSIQTYEKEIKENKDKFPELHINQIISQFQIVYPKRLYLKNEKNRIKKRKFRREALKYQLDNNNRLNIKNPLNKLEEKDMLYKIPYLHEKDILVKQFHINNNHPGRDTLLNLLYQNKWYWLGMQRDVSNIIKSCPTCNKPSKFKTLIKKNKIILDNGPHYRYVADIWYLNNEIKEETGYKYILDIIDHFSKWYNGYLLKTKESKEICKKIDIYIENFGKCNILQVDNGPEFRNNLLESYCKNNNIKLIYSSPYHPQTNGVCEVVHKEIRKYIYGEYYKHKKIFDIESELFNITKIHNNKIHSTTKRIPRDIRDIVDINEIEEINNEILKTLSKKNKYYDFLDFNKDYVIDFNKISINNDRIIKKRGKLKKKEQLIKIPVKIVSEYNKEQNEYIILIRKETKYFVEGQSYIISLDLLEEVNHNLWLELLK